MKIRKLAQNEDDKVIEEKTDNEIYVLKLNLEYFHGELYSESKHYVYGESLLFKKSHGRKNVSIWDRHVVQHHYVMSDFDPSKHYYLLHLFESKDHSNSNKGYKIAEEASFTEKCVVCSFEDEDNKDILSTWFLYASDTPPTGFFIVVEFEQNGNKIKHLPRIKGDDIIICMMNSR